jgi:rod shape-determining protein MreC
VQNTILANKSLLALRLDTAVFHAQTDTVYKQQYVYIAANVVKNSTSNPRNFITLDKGKAQGMEIDMAVISATGVVGVVVAVSNDYSLVISLLNQDYNLSGMVKTKRYLGSVRWPGDSPYEVVMDGIPGHAKMAVGDTIVSSGYSAIFPTGMMVGTIRDVHKPSGSNFYDIRIQLSTDFTTLGPVMAVKNLLKDQQLDLEEVSQ